MTLQARLDRMREGAATRIPAETRAIMHGALDALRASGILAKIIQAGQPLPPFELPDSQGVLVRSDALLAQGPLVLSFYRGLW